MSDTIHLGRDHAKLLQQKFTWGSQAIVTIKSLAKLTKDFLLEHPDMDVAYLNGVAETILGGTVNGISLNAEKLDHSSRHMLNLQYEFHPLHVDQGLADLERLASTVTFRSPLLHTTVLNEGDSINSSCSCRHVKKSVDFIGGLDSAGRLEGINAQTVFVDLGSRPVYLDSIKAELGHETTTVPSI